MTSRGRYMALTVLMVGNLLTFPSGQGVASSSTHRIYWGVAIGSQYTGTEAPWSVAAIHDVQNEAGKGLSLINFGSPFATSTGQHFIFDTTAFNNARNYGAIPVFSWGSSPYTDAQVAAGRQDAYIRSWAKAAKRWGHPLFLRFDWEMNGTWFRWGVGTAGNTARSYIAMWRHVHHIFATVGAFNVTWVWCPNIDPFKHFVAIQKLYPGRTYVNWTCLDGYNGGRSWLSFSQLYRPSYNLITGSIAPWKPMLVGEVASSEIGGSKPTWISRFLSTLPGAFPKIRGFIWDNHIRHGPGGRTDWPFDTTQASLAAFRAGIHAHAYTSNTYRTLSKSPIPRP